MIALAKFKAVVDGEEKTFNVGDTITDAEAKELGLANKPNLAAPAKTDKPKVAKKE